jgi:hypothetical protein
MSTPTKPLRLQVLDRIVEVLKAITEGESYWKTPGTIVRRHIGDREAVAFPVYGIFAGEGRAPEEINGEYTEEFEIVIKGVVNSHTDLVEAMEHAIADIRKAIDGDARDNATAGALGTLTVYVRLGTSATDEGENLSAGFGYFEQRFLVQVAGDPFGA